MLKSLGRIIKKARDVKYNDISLREFSKSIGMTHVAIKNIEDGRVEAKKETLLKLAYKLSLDPDVILAKSAKLDDEIEILISERSDIIPQFLRTAKYLSDDQWKEITNQVKKMDKGNNLIKYNSIKVAKTIQNNIDSKPAKKQKK
tara:strand:+ start:230 stop:664 length:435 start_codon:yes stop_codon:yes gene_type:complete